MRTLKLFGLFLALTSLPTFAEEQKVSFSTHGHIELQRLTVPGGSQLQMSISHDLTPKLGLFAYGEMHRNWGQLYAGPTFAPTSWLKLGVGAGIEDVDVKTPLRYGSFVWLGNNTDWLFATGNFGVDSGYWWKAETNHRFNDWFGAGILVQRDAGIGPRLQLSLSKRPLSLWIAPTYCWETGKPRVVGGLRFQF